MTESIQKFIDATEKSVAHLQSMMAVEQEKRQALLEQDAERLENVLQRQQAMLMQTENLEKKRLAAQEAAGFAGMNGKEILAAAGDADKAALEETFHRLGDAATELRELNKTAMEIARMNLKFMERIMQAPQEEGAALYGATGRKGGGRTVGASFEEEV